RAHAARAHLERQARHAVHRRRHRRATPHLLYGSLSRAALSEAHLGARTLLQRLRRPGARGRVLHRVFAVGHVPRREQSLDAPCPRAHRRHGALAPAGLPGGRLDAEVAESSYTNIMIATHADALVAEAINKGFHGFDYQLAYAAVYKDAMTPPEGDTTRDWHDRQPGVPYEARPGLTYYKQLGYIPVDKTAESASETLEDAYDDYAVAQVARAVGRKADYRFFVNRAHNYRNLYNSAR